MIPEGSITVELMKNVETVLVFDRKKRNIYYI